MRTINCHDINAGFRRALTYILDAGVEQASRNGKVLVFPQPTTVIYTRPEFKVMFHPERDANPFFHLFEAMWMLAGRNDVAFPAKYAANIKNFSTNGETLHAAYGHRLRHHFGFDQLASAIAKLKKDPATRQVYLSLWSAEDDLRDTQFNAKDRACNLGLKFNNRLQADGRRMLDMTCFNRSNDLVWGCFGANIVHMSYFQQYIADAAGLQVGTYYQVADDLHLYDRGTYGDKLYDALFSPWDEKTLKVLEEEDEVPANQSWGKAGLRSDWGYSDLNALAITNPFGLANCGEDLEGGARNVARFDQELPLLLGNAQCSHITHPFLKGVIQPLMRVYDAYKQFNALTALQLMDDIAPSVSKLEDQGLTLSGMVAVGRKGCHVKTKKPFKSLEADVHVSPPEGDLDWFIACREWLQRRIK